MPNIGEEMCGNVSYQPSAIDIDATSMVFTLADEDFSKHVFGGAIG